MWSFLADRFIFSPSRHPIPSDHKERRAISFNGEDMEIWVHGYGDGDHPDYIVLKFHGTGGRAERATDHPADRWPEMSAQLWALNPPGYGGSPGRASLQTYAVAALAAFDYVSAYAAGKPILVCGNSLGTTAALHVAAEREVAGLILRNPPQLPDLIRQRYGWWNFNLLASLFARQIPESMHSVANASKCGAPAIFISSGCDSVVTPENQRLVMEAYAGPTKILHLPEANHACPLTEEQAAVYNRLLAWLRREALDGKEKAAAPTGDMESPRGDVD